MKAFAILALALVACGDKANTGGSTPGGGTGGGEAGGEGGAIDTAAERDDCTTDEDCALVEACCGCNNGGRKVGIRADALAAYEKGRGARCAATSCPAVISDHSSCNAEPVCKKNRCRAQPHMNQGTTAPIPPATTTPAP